MTQLKTFFGLTDAVF